MSKDSYLLRGRLLHCLADPNSRSDAIEYIADGALLIDQGRIVSRGPADELLAELPSDLRIVDHRDQLVIPGMVDCHVHYPQTNVIASFGEQLLTWLNNYTFPAEATFADTDIATETANFFLDELLRNGTTTALVFATVHPQSVDALFDAARQRKMRIAAGKVLMDQNCPENLRDTAESGYRESRDLLERWHGTDRLHYAITPRFAATSSAEQLRAAGQLAAEFPDTLIHTHLAENVDEIAWVAELFPESRSYLDVYDQARLVRERAVFAHCVHLDDLDYDCFETHGASMAFCPTSNLFLGSGLFDLERAAERRIPVGLGTDVGGGTSFSMLRTLSEAYKVLQLNKQTLNSYSALYLATLGGADALGMSDKIGNFETGKEADIVVLNSTATPLIERRLAVAKTLPEELFVQIMLGDDRSIAATFVYGEPVRLANGF